jgi:hypothetical protein
MDFLTYPWHAAYAAAVLETDDSKISERIQKALDAIEERLHNPVDISERVKIEDARIALDVLKSERVGRSAV